MTLSAAHKEAYARAQVDVRHLIALELRHSAWGVLRMIDYDIDIDVALEAGAPANAGQTVEFVAHAMEVREPEISTEPDSTVSLRLDGVSGVLQPLLYDAMQVIEPVLVTVRPLGYNVTTDTVLGVVGALHLEMRTATVTPEQVVMVCGFTNSANQDFPNDNYTPESHPGLYV